MARCSLTKEPVCMCLGVEKGVYFEWGNLSFTLSLCDVLGLFDKIEKLASGFSEEEPDDFTKEIWLGKTMLRYGGVRMPMELNLLYGNLMAAIDRHHELDRWAKDNKTTDEAMREIITDLDL